MGSFLRLLALFVPNSSLMYHTQLDISELDPKDKKILQSSVYLGAQPSTDSLVNEERLRELTASLLKPDQPDLTWKGEYLKKSNSFRIKIQLS